MEEKRDTVGKIALELMQKTPESTDPIELERAMQEDYLKELISCVETNRKIFDADFFVTVITKNEKLMPNCFRNYFAARQSCPTPDYDQSVFKYNSELEAIEYLWTLPSKDAIIHLKQNAMQVHPSEKELLKFVLDFVDGTLMRIAKKLNGEEIESPLLIKG